ncbi:MULTISPECIES: endolytic transglycosylase MltG [Dickeya]|uniref:Endolytic murein transglycosylase n=1 Tax=Dickeya fangzhongdai TaxID=1778540 RepID=A0A2K8QN69_9GAMM|nr:MULTISPECIES: endolytic transglycosylase MltG [Dickeya]ATZ94967.1 endolytic transglycosylase MltG [Dickeya fangzhongdai]QOH48409.1 endolytic transglycosylase MltG [Dickeya fangzhongdai]QOH52711.1 endolytic transglycosylase MltG [Dickeya fangzhongdai]UMB75262.1 endolytic transglycosylase MltG [Dickeya fangzhongdai]WOY00085.1 endolytic transglycosylase MltG [Dickeya fangzhongdai]
MKRIKWGLGIIVLLALGAWWGWKQIQHLADSPLAIRQETIFTLPAGTNREALKELLVEQQIIGASGWFPWLLHLEPELAAFKAGTYRLTPAMTVRDMLALLASGKEAQFSLRFVEGSRLKDWQETLKSAPYLKHTLDDKTPQEIAEAMGLKDKPNPEGWFYPDTYLHTAGMSDKSILQRAHQRMTKMLNDVWQGRDEGLPYKTPDDLLVMASLIEKETAINEERPLVASVFINRLRAGMRLQTDPTVIYGMGDSYNGTITRSALEAPTPYNTYVISGLPPTPIAMPGKASLEAAAHPAKTGYLYFVADGKGGHKFTTNLNDHNRAVQAYRSAQAAAGKEKNEQ